MKSFFKTYYKQLILIFVIMFFCYLFYFQSILSIDTENFINDRESLLLSWIGINRFSLVILKNIFKFPFYILLTRIITFIFFFISVSIYSYLFTNWLNNKDVKTNKILIYIVSLFIGLSPIFAEQFDFTLQSLEVSLGLVLLGVTFVLIDVYINSSKKWIVALIVSLISFIFGLYQAFVPLFISLSCFYLLTHDSAGNFKRYLKLLGFIFLISLTIRGIIGYVFKNLIYHFSSDYLLNNFNWFSKGIFHNILVIGYIGVSTLLGLSYYHLFSYLIIFIIGIVNLFKRKKELIIFIVLAVSPFLLTILTASSVAYRAQFNYIFTLVLMTIYLLNSIDKKKIVNFILILGLLITIREGVTTFNLLYMDKERYLNDIQVASYIKKNVKQNSCLEVIGNYDNKIRFKGETLGRSFYNWDSESSMGSNIRANGFLKSLGYNYKLPSLGYYKKTKNIDIKNVEKIDDCYIVDLSDIKNN